MNKSITTRQNTSNQLRWFIFVLLLNLIAFNTTRSYVGELNKKEVVEQVEEEDQSEESESNLLLQLQPTKTCDNLGFAESEQQKRWYNQIDLIVASTKGTEDPPPEQV